MNNPGQTKRDVEGDLSLWRETGCALPSRGGPLGVSAKFRTEPVSLACFAQFAQL